MQGPRFFHWLDVHAMGTMKKISNNYFVLQIPTTVSIVICRIKYDTSKCSVFGIWSTIQHVRTNATAADPEYDKRDLPKWQDRD